MVMDMPDFKQWLQQELDTYDYALDNYYRKSAFRYLKTLQFTENLVPVTTQMSVAEIGPGPLLPVLQTRTNSSATAYGFVDHTLAERLVSLEVPLVEWDLTRPIPTGISTQQHDLVFFLEVIEHLLRYPDEVLADIISLMKPGGILILTTVNFVRLSNRIRMLKGRSPLINPFVRTVDGRYHVREFCLEELKQYCELAGLKVLDSEYWDFYNNRLITNALAVPHAIMPSIKNYIAIAAQKPVTGDLT